MTTFFCHKLARDKIIEDCEQQNIGIDYHIMNEGDYHKALAQKLQEESLEVVSAQKDELLEELADVQEVLDALLKAHGFTSEQLHQVQLEKREKKGGFDKKIYVNAITVADDSPWKEHFLKQPDKYRQEK